MSFLRLAVMHRYAALHTGLLARSLVAPCLNVTAQPLISPITRIIARHVHAAVVKKKKEYKGKKNTFGTIKFPSKRLGKKYKLKTHQGAAARWMVIADGRFKRGQPGRNHFNSKVRSVKRRSKKSKIISNPTQTRRLKKLLPYFKKKYMK